MQKHIELRPNRKAFVHYDAAFSTFYSLIFLSVLFIILGRFFEVMIYPFVALFIISIAFFSYSSSTAYRKESYQIYPDKIICKGGGISSDHQTELMIRNITHITLSLPFLENKIFRSGDVRIESAGSGAAPIHLASIDDPSKIYSVIESLMRKNGFKLSKSRLIQQERPSQIGVFFEVFKNFSVISFAALFFGYDLLTELDFDYSSILSTVTASNQGLLFFGLTIILITLFLRSLLSFLDLKNRVYDLYDDTIVYREGFLSTHHALIPIENLSDSTLTQTFIDKVFGIYDIRLSCQGASQEISFKNMGNGEAFEKNIDQLIKKSKPLLREVKSTVSAPQKEQKPQYFNTLYTAEFKMDPKRTIIPSVVFLLPILIAGFFITFLSFSLVALLWLSIFIYSQINPLIRMLATRYLVKEKSVEERYDFITQRNVEFSCEKIVGVIFVQTPFDRWFDTCTIRFWSIGSSEPLQFRNIKKTNDLAGSILPKMGIKGTQNPLLIDSHFSFFEMLKSHIFLTMFSVLLALILLVAGMIFSPLLLMLIAAIPLLYLLSSLYRSSYYQESHLKVYGDFVYFTRGLFIKESYYVLHRNIKGISSSKFAYSEVGSMRLDVGGEHMVADDKGGRTRSNRFTICYVADVFSIHDKMDTLLIRKGNGRSLPKGGPNQVFVAKPDAKNTLIPLIGFSILLFPFILLLPLTIPLTLRQIRARSFEIGPARVLARFGILFRNQTSMLYSRINSIDHNQGFLNKACKNGNVSIITAGSSSPQMIVANIPNYLEFYEMLRKCY